MRPPHLRALAGGVVLIALIAWCGWASAFPRSSAAAEATWVAALAAVVALDVSFWFGRNNRRMGWHLEPVTDPWPRPGRGGGRNALGGMAPWLVLAVVATMWDALGIDTGPHQYHLTISALSQAYRPLNALLLLVWMLVGVGYGAARARAPLGARSEKASPEGGLDADGRGGAFLCAAGPALAGTGRPLGAALILPSNRAVGVVFWVGLLVAAVAVDLFARRSVGRLAKAEEFVRFISTATAANVALVVAWAFAGYHLFAR